MSDVEMSRISVQLPAETVEQIGAWAAEAGLKRGQFASTALVIGSRILARQVVPERFLDKKAWAALAEALGLDAEKLQAAMSERNK